MKKPPKTKLAALQIRMAGSSRPILQAEGTLSATAAGAAFRGFWEESPHGALTPAIASFPGWALPTAGRPGKTARDRMTVILRNYLAVDKHDERSRERAESLEGRQYRTLARDREAAMPYVRLGFVLTIEDGRKVAVALMHDGEGRGLEKSGPAWILWAGGRQAEFIADFRMVEKDMIEEAMPV
jgi:hypothetical protein